MSGCVVQTDTTGDVFDDMTFFVFSPAPPNLSDASVAFADYNSNGHPDILLTGWDGSNRHTLLYQNQADGTFNDVTATALPSAAPNLSNSSVVFADYNGDGDPDILLAGWDGTKRYTLLYQNQDG